MNKIRAYRKRSMIPKVIIIAVVAVVLIAGISTIVVRKSYDENLKPVTSSQNAQLVSIPLGSSVKEIGIILKKAGVIRAGWAFEWYVRNNNLRDDIQAGTYYLRPSQSVPEITAELTQGKVATDLVTILPGQRLDQIKKALIANGFSEADVNLALKPANYANHPALVDKPKTASLEGYLYPESFQKTADTKPETIVKSSLDEMQKYLTPETRAGITRQGLTVYEGITLASIIDQEVGSPDEKKMVAQVFLKRLREGMALQSDPTVIYGAIAAGKVPSLTYDSAYNTYTHTGLPPTPISNVSKAALDAVAAPANTDYLYFVAGDDGKTYFSKTLAEHEQLTAEHCKKLCNQ